MPALGDRFQTIDLCVYGFGPSRAGLLAALPVGNEFFAGTLPEFAEAIGARRTGVCLCPRSGRVAGDKRGRGPAARGGAALAASAKRSWLLLDEFGFNRHFDDPDACEEVLVKRCQVSSKGSNHPLSHLLSWVRRGGVVGEAIRKAWYNAGCSTKLRSDRQGLGQGSKLIIGGKVDPYRQGLTK